MKNFLLSFIAIASLVSCTNGNGISNYYPINNQFVQFEGRVHIVADDTVRFTYPGTTILTGFDGDRAILHVKPNCGSFIVQVDSMPAKKITIGDKSSVIIADTVAWRPHLLRITYAVEGYELKPEVYGLEINGRLTQMRANEDPHRHIEFIGNSITCGYGVESNDPTEPFSYDTENHDKTYAALTARALGARHTAIARSGIGIYRNYGDTITGSAYCMPRRYDETLFGDTTIVWDHTQLTPDVVCVNLGTNDTSLDTYEPDSLRNGYTRFVEKLRGYYPEAKIVMLTGSMMHGKALKDVKRALDSVVKKAQKAGDKNIYRFDMTPQTGDLGYGADYHPSVEQQKKMADELTPFLRQITGWQ